MTSIVSGATVDEEGSFTNAYTATYPFVVVKSGQVIVTPDSDSTFAYTADARTTTTTPHPPLVALWPTALSMSSLMASGDPTGAVAGFRKNGAANPLVPLGLTATLALTSLSRLAWQIKGNLLRYYQDAGELLIGPPLSVESVEIPSGRYYIVIFSYPLSPDTDKIIKPRLSRYQPSAYYPKSEQVADFGSTQSSVHVKVYQISGLTGRGDPSDDTV